MQSTRKTKSLIALGVAGVLLVAGISSSVYTVETGTVGVMSTFGEYDPEERLPGLHFKVPLVQTLIPFDVKLQTVNYDRRQHHPQPGLVDRPSITVLDDKNLAIDMDLSVQFRPKAEEADVILTRYGWNYFEKRINPVLRNAVRDVVGHYQAETIAVERKKLGAELRARVKQAFDASEFKIEDVVIRDIRLPKVIMDKVEEVQKAKQEEQRLAMVEKQAMKNQKIESINADTKLIQVTTQAQAQAKKQRIAADAAAYAVEVKANAQAKANELLSKSLTPELIRYRQVDQWNGVMPQTVVGEGAMPLISVPTGAANATR